MTFKQYGCNTTFLDLLWNMLLAFICCFVIAFISMSQEKLKQTKNADLKADFIITINWANESEDDVDLYVGYNESNVVYFRRKEDGLLNLERDDLGQINDSYTTPLGTIVPYGVNREFVMVRKALPGEYTVNCHMYRKTDKTDTPVTVTIEKLSPYKLITTKTVILSKNGDEKTFCRFIVDKDCNVISINELDKSLTKWQKEGQIP